MIINFLKDERKVYSQNGEDGVIEAIFKMIGTTNKYFVEFGVGGGGECNTRLLREQGWDGLQMDCDEQADSFIKKEIVTAENINELFDKYQVPVNFDILSIDIDGNDYWVWKAINRKPRVVVIEYNGYLPVDSRNIIKYNPNHTWNYDSYYGAGLSALNHLGKSLGYRMVYVDFQLVNCFFILEDCLDKNDNFIFRNVIRTDPIKLGHGEWVLDDVV